MSLKFNPSLLASVHSTDLQIFTYCQTVLCMAVSAFNPYPAKVEKMVSF